MKVIPCGDSAMSIRFREEISPRVHGVVMAYAAAIEEAAIPGIVELVPSYCALMVHYDPLQACFGALAEQISSLAPQGQEKSPATGRRVELPVCYGGAYGPDLPAVAKHAGLSENEVIALHCAVEYPVYMLGFTPGFPYLGGMDARIAAPRLPTPRVRVERGSVGIAGEQTGVYPMPSPGGWQIIGRTPEKLYDPVRKEPFLLKAGDRLKFLPIDENEFRRLQGGA